MENKIKDAMLKEMNITKLSDRQEQLVTGLCESFKDLQSIGLNASRIISRNRLDDVLKEQYHQYLGQQQHEEGTDQFLHSVFSLVISRNQQQKKIKP